MSARIYIIFLVGLSTIQSALTAPCPNNYYGEKCDLECPINCHNDACDEVDGKCLFGCKPYYYGPYCKQRCMNCKGGKCKQYHSKATGDCEDGCTAGWRGEKCDMNCKIGNYGEDCKSKCNCDFGTGCDPVTGVCPGGCKSGFEGAQCHRDARLLTDTTINLLPIAVSVAFFLITASVLLCFLVYKKIKAEEYKLPTPNNSETGSVQETKQE